MLRKRSAVALVLLSGFAAQPAQAHVRPKRPDPVTAALAIAFRYWHIVPCSGQIHVENQSPPFTNDASLPVGSRPSMFSSWQSSLGENEEAAPLPFWGCRIVINRAVWTSAYMEAYAAWPEFSVDMIHEVGHLLGLPDLFDPARTPDIMYVEPNPLPRVTGETLWR